LADFTRRADILVAAMGVPRAITADMVREGAVVIDVGVNRVEDPSKKSGFRLVGDTDFDALVEVAEAITPVPGGVGPMTVTMLMWNTVVACETQTGLSGN
jgi:methylenetetrahydrofolate dehydrogenase (NADP+)/methenyltetrahydrofolate cyclohydrolase